MTEHLASQTSTMSGRNHVSPLCLPWPCRVLLSLALSCFPYLAGCCPSWPCLTLSCLVLICLSLPCLAWPPPPPPPIPLPFPFCDHYLTEPFDLIRLFPFNFPFDLSVLCRRLLWPLSPPFPKSNGDRNRDSHSTCQHSSWDKASDSTQTYSE